MICVCDDGDAWVIDALEIVIVIATSNAETCVTRKITLISETSRENKLVIMSSFGIYCGRGQQFHSLKYTIKKTTV